MQYDEFIRAIRESAGLPDSAMQAVAGTETDTPAGQWGRAGS